MSELHSLPLFHRIAGQTVLVLGDGDAAEPKRRLVERAGGIVTDDQQRAIDEGVRLAFIAFEDAKACEVAAINLRCAGMLVNVVDRPDLCDFTTPSILDRDPVLIAVATGGASAGLAKHLRLRLERLLPQSLGELAARLFGSRDALRSAYPDAGQRRRALDAALTEGGPLDPFDPHSAGRVDEWLAGSAPVEADRTVILQLASTDPDELTLKQARLLGEADTVCSDAAIPTAILTRARADARRVTCDSSICPFATGASDRCPKASGGLTVVLCQPPQQ